MESKLKQLSILVYRVDIDNTLCDTGLDYEKCTPYKNRINHINSLYNLGHIIIIETGRHWNHFKMTEKQLKEWGVKYHSLIMGKPHAIIVDDMAIEINKFFKE